MITKEVVLDVSPGARQEEKGLVSFTAGKEDMVRVSSRKHLK